MNDIIMKSEDSTVELMHLLSYHYVTPISASNMVREWRVPSFNLRINPWLSGLLS